MLRRATDRAWQAIRKWNAPDPVLFRFGDGLFWIAGADGNISLQAANALRMRHLTSHVIDWYTENKQGNRSPAKPPQDVIQDLLAKPNPPVPNLERIVRVPVFGPNGELPSRPGYHKASKVFYAPPPDLHLPRVPRRPTKRDLINARRIFIEELLVDFPFVDDGSRALAIALCILPIVRSFIEGPTPIHLIEKPAPGTGGSLLATALTYPTAGDSVGILTEARLIDEWRYSITAVLRESPPFILLDNLRKTLDSSALAAAVTSPVWKGRLVGTSEMTHTPVTCAWVCTGNNPRLSEEMDRRAVRIRLDAGDERPWLRSGFRHPELLNWVTANRGEIVWAALVFGRAWIAQGRPLGSQTLGAFESWARVLGGILNVVEIPGFSEAVAATGKHDVVVAEWLPIAKEWWARFHTNPVGVGDLLPVVKASKDAVALGDGSEQSQRIRLGLALAGLRSRRIGPFSIEPSAPYQGGQRWRLLNDRA